MTQGLRTWRALGAGLALIVFGMTGCMGTDKKPTSTAPLRRPGPVGPASAGGLPGQMTPTTSRPGAATTMPPGMGGPSVQPAGTTSSFGSSPYGRSGAPEMSGPAPGYQPGMSAPSRPMSSGTMPLSPGYVPGPTEQPAANNHSMLQIENDVRLAAHAPPSGMRGAASIPASVPNLPPGPTNMELEPFPPPMPGASEAVAHVMPPTSQSFAPIVAPTPPPPGGGQ